MTARVTASRLSRRDLILGSTLTLPLMSIARGNDLMGPLGQAERQQFILDRRRDAALRQLRNNLPSHATNGDEDRYPDRRASFSKTMPHNDLGEVDPNAYRRWLEIVASGDPAQFEHAPRDPQAIERLNDPQAAYAIDLVGPDATALQFPASPAFASERMAAEMTELYWLALMRDVPFRDYDSNLLASTAVADLQAAGFGAVDTARLFRSEFSGDLRGPFVSQFLWHDIPYGLKTVDQRFRVPAPAQGFLTTFGEWLACQRGARPESNLRFDPEPRYIANYRALTEYVHRDFSFQPFMDAALIILRMGGDRGDDVLSPTNPYRGSRSQFGDITFGNKNLLSMLAQASLLAQKASYYLKWQVHRRARPETFGGRVDVHQTGGKSYDIHSAVLRSDGLARIKAESGSYLLPMAYPEGSPTHPSYPAAHAVNAGACATVLKAFVDEGYEIPWAVEASVDGLRLEPWRGKALTLGGEIDKLASNIALARDAAGVHFRSDSVEGLKLGEAVAIGLLADYSRTYSEQFDGFVLTRFDGGRVRVSSSSVDEM
jgi:hypothetical protein